MGANNAAERLEVAKDEVGRLEREVATLRAEKDSPHADAKYWGELQVERAGRADDYEWMKAKVDQVAAERCAALAAITRVLNLTGDIGPEARRILTQAPVDALAEHDKAVADAARVEAARDERIIWALYLWSVVEDSMEDAVSVHDKAVDEAFQTVAGYLVANVARGIALDDRWLDDNLIETARRMPSLKREHPESEHHEIDIVIKRVAECQASTHAGIDT